MTILRQLFFISGLILSGMVASQEVNVSIIEGFKKGDVKILSPYLAEVIEYIGPNTEASLNKGETVKVLEQFFASHKVNDFKIKHSGKSPLGSLYSIAILSTNKGVYRTYLLFNEKDKKMISEIRLEKDE